MMEIVFTYQKKGQEYKVLTKINITDMNDYWKLEEMLEKDNYSIDIININSKENTFNISDKFTLDMALQVASEDYYTGIFNAMVELSELGFKTNLYFELAKIEELFEKDDCFIRDLQYKLFGIYDIMQQAYDIVWE